MRPALLPSPKAGALLPPANFPAGGFGDSRSPRRVFLPRAGRRDLPSATFPAAAEPLDGSGARGVLLTPFADPTRARPPSHGTAESPAVASPGDRGADLLYAPAGRLDLPATLRWALPPADVAALAATLLFGTAGTIWFAALCALAAEAPL